MNTQAPGAATWQTAYPQREVVPGPVPDVRPAIEAVGIVVSAHSGATAVEPCLHGLFAAHRRCGWCSSLWIVVVAEQSTAQFAGEARRSVGAFGSVLLVPAQRKQTLLQIGDNAVFEHFHRKPRHLILLAHIGADTRVAPEWLGQQLERRWPS